MFDNFAVAACALACGDRWGAAQHLLRVQAARAVCQQRRATDAVWWQNPDLWDDDGPGDGVDRPTEDVAIARVRRQAQRHALLKLARAARARHTADAPVDGTPEDVA